MSFPQFLTGGKAAIENVAVQMSTGSESAYPLMWGVRVYADPANTLPVIVGRSGVTAASSNATNQTVGVYLVAPSTTSGPIFADFRVTTLDQLYCIATTTTQVRVQWVAH